MGMNNEQGVRIVMILTPCFYFLIVCLLACVR